MNINQDKEDTKMATAIFNRASELKKKRILNRIANEWYGESFDELSIDHKDEVFTYALEAELIKWEVI